MGYVYQAPSGNPSPYVPFKANRSAPVDERFVIDTRANLVERSTWGYYDELAQYWVNNSYDGIIVSVVDDEVYENNGVYMLKKRKKYTKFADIDDTDPDYSTLYDPDGWRKISGGSSPVPASVVVDNYTIKNNSSGYEPDDTQELPALHVVRIDGGSFQ